VGSGGDDIGVAEGRGMHASGDQTGEMGHVDHQIRPDLVGNDAEAREVEDPRIGRTAGDDQLGLVLECQPLDFVEVDQMVFLTDAILNGVEPLARLRGRSAMSEVPAGGEAHAEDGVPG
jgi:hypothetical protein